MDDATRAELTNFGETAGRWLDAEEIPELPLDLDEKYEVVMAWHQRLYRAGWIGIAWPVEYGGRGLTWLHQLVFNEQMILHGAPTPLATVGLEVIGPTVLHAGSDSQRRELIPPMLAGEELWCQGFSEPDAGSDLASLRTRARADGDDFVISGQKTWTTWAHKARWCGLLARTSSDGPKHRGISFFLVDMRSAGISVRPIRQMTGDAEFSEVFFDDVRVPGRALVGVLNQGWAYAMHSLSHERGPYMLKRFAEVDTAFTEALAQMYEPVPERAIDDIGHVALLLEAFRAQGARTIRRILAGEDAPSALDSADKLSLTAVEQAAFGAVEDLLGPFRATRSARPHGLTADRWIHEYLYGRAASIYGGTAQIQRNILSERLLGMPKDRP